MDRLEELSTFLAIVDSGSLAAAARRLRKSPPAVTRSLAALEERVGTVLIARTTRRLAPTEAGVALAEQARQILSTYQAMIAGAEAGPLRGLLRVTAPVQFGRRHVAPVVATFLDAYPGLLVELVLNDRNLDLLEEGLDVAVRIGPLANSSLVVRKLGTVRRLVVASPAYLARRGVPRRPADLARHDIIFNSLRPGPREWQFGGGRRPAVRISPRLLVNDVEAQLVAARAGRGLAQVLSYQVADELASGSLAAVLTDFEPPRQPVQLVSRGGAHPPPKVRAFLDHAAQQLRTVAAIRD